MKQKLLFLMTMVLLLFETSFAQINYSENFNSGSTGWTGNILRTTSTSACGSASMRRNMYNTNATGNMISPNIGSSLGGQLTLSYNYKIANWSANTVGTPNPWGSFNVQYSNSVSGPWTTVQTIDQTNHIVSGTCANKTVSFTAPAGAVYIKWDAFWSAGDYYINFDDVIVTEMAANVCTGTPNPGNTISSTASTCLNSNFNLSLQNGTPGTGVTYLWQSADDNAFTSNVTNLGTASTQITSQSAPKFYRCQVTCSGNTGTSNPVFVDQNLFYNCYCAAVPSSIDGQGATNIEIASFSNPNVATTPYQNFTNLGPIQLTEGTVNSTTVSLQTGYTYRVLVFVDLNKDGDYFDANEMSDLGLSTSANPTSITGNVSIPSGTIPGITGLRLVVTDSDINTSVCYNGSFGNVEDYLVNINVAPPCSGSPDPGNTLSSTLSACESVPFTLSLQNQIPGTGITYLWQSADDGDFTSNVSTLGTQSTQIASQTTAKYYRCHVTCESNTTISNPLYLGMGDFYFCNYCSSSFPSNVEPITKVSFADIYNVTSPDVNDSTDTENFTNLTANVGLGQTYTITLEGNTAGNYSNSFRVFIDFNHNGNWTDSGESFDIGNIVNSTGLDGKFVSADITIPVNAVPGQTYMRVSKKYNAFPVACETLGYGQAEDYSVNICNNVYYADGDGDNFGDVQNSIYACEQPEGYVSNHDDCDDENPAINPEATDVCNETDDDCDSLIDEICGCTDANAHNYDEEALLDDGSCLTCSDGIQNGDEVNVDCGGTLCDPCPPPTAVCGNIVTVYTGGGAPAYNGPGTSDVWNIPAESFDAGSIVYGTLSSRQVKRTLTNIAFNWTTNGACIDATPNATYNNNDKGLVYRDCLPVATADFNKVRNFDMTVTDQFGTGTCSGRYIAINSAPPGNSLIGNDLQIELTKALDNDDEFSVFPNPGINEIFVKTKFNDDAQKSITVYDIMGRIVYKMDKVENALLTIDTQNFNLGTYTIILQSDAATKTIKWLKVE